MSSKSRDTLKSYFRAGHRPTESEFADLIDSALNMDDEGFRKTLPDGLRITTQGASSNLMSFYWPRSTDKAEWSIGFANGVDQLFIARPAASSDEAVASGILSQGGLAGRPGLSALAGGGAKPAEVAQGRLPILTLDGGGSVGINNVKPQAELDVAGTVRSFGRLGRQYPDVGSEYTDLKADGRYQPISDDLNGCHAFEVIAGVGHARTGRFALVHAIALNTFNPIWWDDLLGTKRRIRAQHAYYTSAADRIQLRWGPVKPHGRPDETFGLRGQYQLQIRTRRDYTADLPKTANVAGKGADADKAKAADASNIFFRAYVTQLWRHPLSEDAPAPGPGA